MVCFRHVFVTSDDGFSCLSVSLVISSKLDTSCLVKVIELHRHLGKAFMLSPFECGAVFVCGSYWCQRSQIPLSFCFQVLAWLSPGGHGNPLQCSCLENPMDGGAWRATVHGVAQSWTRMKWLDMHVCRSGFPLYCFSEDGSAFHRFF